jgi:hypothetical protein
MCDFCMFICYLVSIAQVLKEKEKKNLIWARWLVWVWKFIYLFLGSRLYKFKITTKLAQVKRMTINTRVAQINSFLVKK